MDLKSKIKSASESIDIVFKNINDKKDILVSSQEYMVRMFECQKCPSYNKLLKQCNECGCFLAIKGRLADMKCPKGLWKNESESE